MLSKLSRVTQPINDRAEIKTWSVKPMSFPLCHSYCWAQWDTTTEHVLVKFHHGSVLSVFTPEGRKAICLKDNLHFIHVPGWWDEREAAMVLPARLQVLGVLIQGQDPSPGCLKQGVRLGLSKVTCVKLNLRWITALNVKAKTIKLSEEHVEEEPQNHNLDVGKDFLDRTQEANVTGKGPKLDLIKVKIFCSSKYTIKKMKGVPWWSDG